MYILLTEIFPPNHIPTYIKAIKKYSIRKYIYYNDPNNLFSHLLLSKFDFEYLEQNNILEHTGKINYTILNHLNCPY